MADLRTLVESEMGRAGEPALAFEDLVGLRVRRHRTKRIAAAAVGLGLVLILALVGTSIYRSAPVPADRPEEPSLDLGIFEPVAGKIVYYTDSSLWAVDPNAPSPVSTLVRLDPEGTADAGRFASFTIPLGWSSDGTRLLFLREDPTDDTFPYDRYLYILHADGIETQVTPEPVESAAISPDGSRVVFAPEGDGLYVVDTEGGQPVRITEHGNSPTFSPDGTQIAYLGLPRVGCCVEAGREHVWVANADGTDAHEILADEPTLDKGAGRLAWSPAGDRIAMEDQGGNVAIYTFAPDGSDFTKVITGGFNHSWSPDGSQIAYALPGRDGLSIADADGSNVRTFGFAAPGPWHPGTLENGAGESRPSPSPGFSRFNSTIHGISIDYPSGWQTRPATEPWNHDAFTFDASGVDVIFDPTLHDDLYLSLASKPLGGQSAEGWLWASAQVCENGGNFGKVTVDGAEASIRGCDGFANRFEDHVVQVATATHLYVIYLHVGDDPFLQATYNEDWFDAVLETVELR